MKVIALTRISTAHQQIESQSDKVIQRILQDGWSRSDIIEIRGVESASKLSENERLTLNQLKETIESQSVEAVYVFEISRIARKASILYSIRDYLQAHHVQLISMNPPLQLFNSDWTISTAAAMLFSIFSTLSEQETYIRVERTMRGKQKKAAEGKLTSGKPLYGYSILQDKTIIVNPEQARIVHEIYDRYQSGETSGSIAKDLYLTKAFNVNRLTTVRCYVSDILRDQRYTGILPYPEIISKKQFDICKAIRESTHDKFARVHYTDKEYLLAGLIYTDEEYAMTPSYSNNRYAKCNDSQVKNMSVNMKVVDEIAVYALKQFLLKGGLASSQQEEQLIIQTKLERMTEERIGIDRRISELTSEISRINQRIVKGRMSETEGDKLIDSNYKEMSKLEDLKIDLDYEITTLNNRYTYVTSFMYSNELPPLKTYIQKKNELRRHCEKVIVSKLGWGTFSIQFKWKFHDKMTWYKFYSTNHGYKLWDAEGIEIKNP